MKTFLTAASLLALATMPALAETLPEKTGINSTLGIAPTTADFVNEAAISDMFEIQSSKLAEARTSGQTKTFAETMVKDHTKTTDQLKSLAEKAHVTLPTALDSSHQKMLDKLKDMNGEDFAKEYRSDQQSGHKEAVALFKRYSKGGNNQEVKTWASDTLPALEHHLQMADNLNK